MKLGVAVIGCGTIGTVHAESYTRSKHARLEALVDLEQSKAEALAEKHGARTACRDYRDVLADDAVQGVSVCLPNHLHAAVTIDCLRAGKHVLCEKPIAMSLDEARSMQKAAGKAGRLLAVGVVNRFNEYVNLVRKTIASGTLGEIYHVNFLFKAYRSIPGLGGWFTTKALSGGGVMIDWGIHFLDLVMYCLGFPVPRTVSGVQHSRLARKPKDYAYVSMWAGPPDYSGTYDVEEYVSGILRTAGPDISFEGAWAQNVDDSVMQIDFHGDRGGIRLRYGGDYTVYTARKGVLYETTPKMRTGNMFDAEMDSFASCALRGTPSPASIDTVLVSQQIIDGFYASAEAGREIAFS